MRSFDPADYGPVFAPLLSGDRLRPLDAGMPRREARASLESATIDAAFAHARVADRAAAAACLAGLWLLHDFLDESHAISQSIADATGSFWHGIMHRREGDFSNAKYWFRRVGSHPVLAELGDSFPELGAPLDPAALVDRCQAAVQSGGPEAAFCCRVQQLEWERLFDHSSRQATAADRG